MSTWEALGWLFAFLATVALLDWLAVLLVRAEERWKEAEDAERRAASAKAVSDVESPASDRAAGEDR